MAEIPVKRTSGGIPWWVWAVLALLMLALLFWLFSDDDDAELAVVAPVATVTETGAPVATVSDASASTGPITDLATIVGTADLATLSGRNVQLSNVRVQSVVGDRTFWVGPDENHRAFVVLNETPTPGTPIEGRYDVTRGQIINVNGVMRGIDDPAFKQNLIQNLPAGQQTVIHAQSLDIVQRP